MTFDKFTIKAQETVQEAVNLAQRSGQQSIEPVHLLKALMDKARDVTNFIFQKLGVNTQQIEMLLEQEIKHLPRVQGGQPYLSNDTNQILVNAENISQKMGDQFVSVEPILLAILASSSTAGRILKDAGCNDKDMRAAINEKRKYYGKEPLSASDFLKLMREKRQVVQLDNKLASRAVNEGFSGGEKKRNEIFQMAMLEPKLSILDETDSGLDIDALRIVAEGVNTLKTANNATIVITHYQRLLDYIKPDFVHVLYKGRIVMSAGPELVMELEEKGYDWIKEQVDKKGE